MKKTYIAPEIAVIVFKHSQALLSGSITTVSNLDGFQGYGGYGEEEDEAD